MAELVDAPDLGSGGRPCRFESCCPHHFGAKLFAPALVLPKEKKVDRFVLFA